MTGAIGALNEQPLHAALKEWYALPGDQFEVSGDGFIADIVRGDLLIDIQTRQRIAMKRKLHKLVEDHPLWSRVRQGQPGMVVRAANLA